MPFRGAWISTVHNLDWPSKGHRLPHRAELVRLQVRQGLGLTDVFLQVRPEGDAFYRSSLEPWSRFLTGTGKDRGGTLGIRHRRGQETRHHHAWFSPTALPSKPAPRSSNHMARRFSPYAYRVGSIVCMDRIARGAGPRGRVVTDVAPLRGGRDPLRRLFLPIPARRQSVGFPDSKTFQRYRRRWQTRPCRLAPAM